MKQKVLFKKQEFIHRIMPPRFKESSLYRTTDIQLAATLLCQNHEIQSIEGDSKKIIVFEKTAILEDDIEQYWKDNLRIEPKRLFEAFREVKTRIWSE